MATIIEDVLSGANVAQDQDKYTAQRVFIVYNLVESGRDKITEALGLVPLIGADYGERVGGQQLFCVNRSAEMIDGSEKVRVVCSYAPDEKGNDEDGASIYIGATVQEVETTFDKDGNVIEIADPDNANLKQAGTVRVQKPNIVVRFARQEEDPEPETLAVTYVGKINKNKFLGLNPRKVLCTAIEADSKDGGKNYDMRYEFQIDMDEWKATIGFIDEATGTVKSVKSGDARVAPTIANGGLKTVYVYPEADFNALGLNKKDG